MAYYLPSDPKQFSWTLVEDRSYADERIFEANLVSLGPAEKHAHLRQGDEVFDQSVVSNFSAGGAESTVVYQWTADGVLTSSGVDVEIDMHYLRVFLFALYLS